MEDRYEIVTNVRHNGRRFDATKSAGETFTAADLGGAESVKKLLAVGAIKAAARAGARPPKDDPKDAPKKPGNDPRHPDSDDFPAPVKPVDAKTEQAGKDSHKPHGK